MINHFVSSVFTVKILKYKRAFGKIVVCKRQCNLKACIISCKYNWIGGYQ
ncbi:hypothetical protein HMPREF3213_03888 [Heyndrickxia coagulans]|uniref:Uncharacterized protein n=1 Tax=Heyndrickxia coagulans TaxID=1398 RepID=A0A133K9J0_HEYCO|nr:hypothetical protein HMPREF3213_03888 [Heyndrickxia coagulans]